MTESSRRPSPSSIVVAGVVLWTVVLCRPSPGQITLDGTLGPSGPLAGPDFTIPADVGKQVGGNLFHSFGEFNVHEGESATFTGPPTVRNVIGRVTGGDPSTIDGRLASDIPGADLYLVNPRGVMFGSNASVDVKGSFAVSTADYIRLGKTGRFDATDPARSILTVDPPAAFGFLGDRPGSNRAGRRQPPGTRRRERGAGRRRRRHARRLGRRARRSNRRDEPRLRGRGDLGRGVCRDRR